MNSWNKMLLALALTIAGVGCGKLSNKFGRGDFSQTTVQLSGRVAGANGEVMPLGVLTGHAIVYAINQDNTGLRGAKYLNDEADVTSWTIPSGLYKFYVLGFSGAFATSGSLPYCGSSPPISLTGGSIAIPLVMTAANCTSSTFTYPTWLNGGAIPLTQLALCSSASTVTIGSNCGTSTATGQTDVRISLPEYTAFNGEVVVPHNTPNIESPCLTASGNVTSTFLKIPVGSAEFDAMVIGFNSYVGNTPCVNGSSTKYLYGLPRGMLDTNYARYEVNGSPIAFPSVPKVIAGYSSPNLFIYLRDLP